ncbi:hypothetical protein [Spiroplasma phoeniceum]|uniref:Transmembrane protein n=1 Tax=Spiroplasma phoeniceum P40 TaxID=1276259 RepID=A0A345DMY9_9MOLU|nr:hypothetical protein [Spiroplasma phoeniceum]AXF95577.1 hypothetical protein SDAV_00586 [Spiroplasma phoeniceum P40]
MWNNKWLALRYQKQQLIKLKHFTKNIYKIIIEKITSFWRKSIIVDVIFSSLILIFTTALFIGIILTFIANNNDPELTFYLIYLPLPLLVITIIVYMLIKAGAISISLFLNRLDYNEYYRIAIADLWKDEVILDEISNNFKIITEPNFTSFSKNPKKIIYYNKV